MRNIVIAGDLILDYHLVQHPVMPSYHREHLRNTVLYRQPGGAWYLRRLVALACSDRDFNIWCAPVIEDLNIEPRKYVNQSYSVWSLHTRDKERKEQVWRINKFLGYQPPAKGTDFLKVAGDAPNPDVLVLDDLGLGFRDKPGMWPKALSRGGNPASIVMKTVAPLCEGVLWEHLRDHHLDRLTLVIRVKDLRLRRATISSSLSWDSTIEEIVKEFQDGLSSQDLALCRRVIVHFEDAGAAVFTRLPLRHFSVKAARGKAEPGPMTERARLERFIYHPEELEGSWLAKRPGSTYGTSSIITSLIVRHELEPETYSLCTALMRALSAMKINHDYGGGKAESFLADIAEAELASVFHPARGERVRKEFASAGAKAYSSVYCTAFDHTLLSDHQLKHQPPSSSNLLQDLTGVGFDYVEATATEVVMRGWEHALKFSPRARYGKYLTVDRDEIERINSIRSVILSYQSNFEDRQPLAIAVFGPPGSGKSFAIKQLASELFGEDKAVLEFNISQFHAPEDLHNAFQRVRDASVQGQIPLVFWDEFDSDNLKWLKEFLVPLQDAKFQAGSYIYPFGKSIFIFAGGTCFDFESFAATKADAQKESDFRAVKGPDFVSRLRGFVNIKGPNALEPGAQVKGSVLVEMPVERADEGLGVIEPGLKDMAHLIRRGVLLRSTLERYHSRLIDAKTKFAFISSSVIRGFLRVRRFLHGARSLEAVVNMSALTEANYFGVAELPPPDLLRLHVTEDFLDKVHEGQVLAPAIEAIAAEYHETRRKSLLQPSSDKKSRKPRSSASADPQTLRYAEVTELDREYDRMLARLLPAKLLSLGYRIAPRHMGTQTSHQKINFSKDDLQQIMKIEHDIWLRRRLLKGYEWGSKNDEGLLLHKDVTAFEGLSSYHGGLDRAVAEKIPNVLWKNGYALIKV